MKKKEKKKKKKKEKRERRKRQRRKKYLERLDITKDHAVEHGGDMCQWCVAVEHGSGRGSGAGWWRVAVAHGTGVWRGCVAVAAARGGGAWWWCINTYLFASQSRGDRQKKHSTTRKPAGLHIHPPPHTHSYLFINFMHSLSPCIM